MVPEQMNSTSKPRVIVVEDESDLNAAIVAFLNLSGFMADGVRSVAQLDAWLASHACELAVLDLGLPDGAGLSVIERLRGGGQRGVVVITARGLVQDKVNGYAMGADNYLVKPINMHELVAVLSALYQRLPPRIVPWQLDVLGWRLIAPDGHLVRLTSSEVAVMGVLAATPGQPASRAAIAQALGLRPADYDPRRLEILIRRLRRKVLEITGTDVPIETAHGIGYAFTAALTVLDSPSS